MSTSTVPKNPDAVISDAESLVDLYRAIEIDPNHMISAGFLEDLFVDYKEHAAGADLSAEQVTEAIESFRLAMDYLVSQGRATVEKGPYEGSGWYYSIL